jgi:hypothetical protein
LVLLTCFVTGASGDPLPGQFLAFSQQPMDGVTIPTGTGTTQRFWGHDELSTAYGVTTAAGTTPTVYSGRFMADDFADKFSTPVVHVKWWGSYLNNFTSPNMPVDRFLISFESDVPDPNPNDPADFSRPGQPLLNQIVRRGPLAPGSGTFTETPISAGGAPLNETLYEYNAELHLGKEFFQKPDTVYWLKIAAMVDLPPVLANIDPINPPTFVPRWGWHNRDYTVSDPLASTAPAVVPGEHIDGFLGPAPGGVPIWHFQDDAVTGRVRIDTAGPMGGIMPVIVQDSFLPQRYTNADGPQPIVEFSKDLAFELYKVPEPATCCFVLLGVAWVAATRRRPHGA